MIDTMGYGIHVIHLDRARRPMLDYDLSEAQGVALGNCKINAEKKVVIAE